MSRLKTFVALAGASLILAACATQTNTTVFVPVVAPTPPSSLTPQPIMLFNQTKDGRKLFTLDAEFPYCDVETGKVIVVPRWYVTDFASVPWYGQAFIDPQGPTARAAIVHDWLYTIGEPGKREEADQIFLRAMLKYGVQPFQANVAYQAVRLGGEKGYGLPTDWRFVDPKRQDFSQPAPFAKPRTGMVRYLPKCQGFTALIQTGWRAYPIKTAPIVAPPPVVITRTPLDQVKSKLPFGGGDKKK
jgi:hypothetical protein